jgi:hypothetical protein
MKTLNDLFDLIKQSTMTLVGYTFMDERIKDELISNFNYVEIEEIDSSFSFKSFLRDLKLKSILENTSVKNPEYLVLDLNNIRFKSDDFWDRHRQIKALVEHLRDQAYTECSSINTPQFKIILTTSIYISGINSEGNYIQNFTSGGSDPLYVSDLAFTISNYKIKVIKNRSGYDGDEILYNTKQIVEF